MDVAIGYRDKGYAALDGFVPVELCTRLFDQFMGDLHAGAVKPALNTSNKLLNRNALELHGANYAPMATFHWGLTAALQGLTGAALLPTHCYFRIYNRGDICRPHNDREACEHSLSLMLASEGEAAWPLDIGVEPTPFAERRVGDFAQGEGHASLPMRPGDAVLYQGITRRHGRMTPNPNSWSAHLFLHWVERDGAYSDEAFGQMGSTLKRRAARGTALAENAADQPISSTTSS